MQDGGLRPTSGYNLCAQSAPNLRGRQTHDVGVMQLERCLTFQRVRYVYGDSRGESGLGFIDLTHGRLWAGLQVVCTRRVGYAILRF
jgi:hypothetical protein